MIKLRMEAIFFSGHPEPPILGLAEACGSVAGGGKTVQLSYRLKLPMLRCV